MRPEMRLVESPQGLHRNVKRAAAQLTEALAFLDQFAQLGRRLHQLAGFVEARDFAVRPIEAEDPLEALDLVAHPQDRTPRECGVGVPQRELRQCAKHFAVPAVQLSFRRGRAHRRDDQRQAGNRRNDAQETTACRTSLRARTIGRACSSCEFLFRHCSP